VEPHGFNTKRFMAELEKPNFLMMDASEYGKKLVADRKMLKSREALVTE